MASVKVCVGEGGEGSVAAIKVCVGEGPWRLSKECLCGEVGQRCSSGGVWEGDWWGGGEEAWGALWDWPQMLRRLLGWWVGITHYWSASLRGSHPPALTPRPFCPPTHTDHSALIPAHTPRPFCPPTHTDHSAPPHTR